MVYGYTTAETETEMDIYLLYMYCVQHDCSQVPYHNEEARVRPVGPSAPQQLYYFEPYFGQVLNPTADPLPS